jgi:2-polyprenyl-3-methyl-5-hydroxy-6-metoxy-1,4-benzoquinol methylase
MPKPIAKETQNQSQIDDYQKLGPAQMGPWTSYIWRSDPRHLLFLLSRYKFCAKVLSGKSDVLEVGCGDGFGSAIVLQTVKSVHGIDFEPFVIAEAKKLAQPQWAPHCCFSVHDIVQSPMSQKFDAAYSLDVLEHIPPSAEIRFMENICSSVKPDAFVIIGTPNLEASKHASPASAAGHINLKSGETLRSLLLEHCVNVTVFSMNDEVVHTGYYPMAHYLIGVGCGVRAHGA